MPALSLLPRPLRMPGALVRAVTYTRWLHLLIGSLPAVVCSFVYPGWIGLLEPGLLWVLVLPLPLLWCAAILPDARLAEGLQARLMLRPGPHARHSPEGAGTTVHDGLSAAPSASWNDRARTALWLTFRHQLGFAVAWSSVVLTTAVVDLLVTASSGAPQTELGPFLPSEPGQCLLLAAAAFTTLVCVVVLPGRVALAAARLLLGPSPTELLAAAEERTEAMLERSRLAGELHDSIGHALTLSVVQAGAARAAGSPEFTERALSAIESSGREALEDLERVLRLLREDAPRPASRPGVEDAGRLLASARAAGAQVTERIRGPLGDLPGPVSREGYRILQEALTNVLRHAGPVPVAVSLEAGGGGLELEVRNPLPESSTSAAGRAGGRGLRGIRERAELLGGRAETGPAGDEWRVRAVLPQAPPGGGLRERGRRLPESVASSPDGARSTGGTA
ncbi:two-component sensor histidine kinase [Streptomyces daqingensis]|uniref:histidine kinase n=1 Tax=Streptomyces daqingensis TaxID=1472640 RepID=A0ABQ2MMT3_9ACTN|nr:histidine kinase [Streptomyces daqingensis]GGO54209.1 two-component sensor histidine kinase [Streptomyces daqingensis]